MTTKYTPGPWIARINGDREHGAITSEKHLIASVDCRYGAIGEPEANVKLIAATPDLLQALELAIRFLDHPEVKAIPFAFPVYGVITQARAAIAKAKGE